jgi:hypothetical protein
VTPVAATQALPGRQEASAVSGVPATFRYARRAPNLRRNMTKEAMSMNPPIAKTAVMRVTTTSR